MGMTAVLAACQTYRPATMPVSLRGTQWVLIEYKAEPGDTRATEVRPNRYTLSLAQDGSARAKLDCNNGRTGWTASEPTKGSGTITFDRVAATRARCPDDMLGERLAADLPRMTAWSVYDGRLTLKPASGGPEYVWDRVD